MYKNMLNVFQITTIPSMVYCNNNLLDGLKNVHRKQTRSVRQTQKPWLALSQWADFYYEGMFGLQPWKQTQIHQLFW